MKKQRGLTLVEILVSLAILASVMTGATVLINQYIEGTEGAVAAQHVRTVGDAARAYIKANYLAVQNNATDTQPALISIPMLIATGYLQSGFSVTNGKGQSVCVLVLEPSVNNLTAMVVAEGGTAYDDFQLGAIAGSIGATGAGIYSSDTATIRGAMGGWSIPVGNFANANSAGKKCDDTAGTPVLAVGHPFMALWFEHGDTTEGLLHRESVPGQPQRNTMNTPILLGDGVERISGDPCTTLGAISRGVKGSLMSCQENIWQEVSEFWKEPVEEFDDLPECKAERAWQVKLVQKPDPKIYVCNGTTLEWVEPESSGGGGASGYIFRALYIPSGYDATSDIRYLFGTGKIVDGKFSGVAQCYFASLPCKPMSSQTPIYAANSSEWLYILTNIGWAGSSSYALVHDIPVEPDFRKLW